MKTLLSTIRKWFHIVLFVILIGLQYSLFLVWNKEENNRQHISETIKEAAKPNVLLELINHTNNSLMEADNNFNKYAVTYDKYFLLRYNQSVHKLIKNLDSLVILTNSNTDFKNIIAKKNLSLFKVANLRKTLDSLIDVNTNLPYIQGTKIPASIKKYDINNLLNSITYDTMRVADSPQKKKSFFKRLSNALSGKETVKNTSETVLVKMKLGNKVTSAPMKEQIMDLSNDIETYYSNNLDKIRTTYDNLRQQDQQILNINEKILSKSKSIVSFYSDAANILSENKYSLLINNYSQNSQKQSKSITTILVSFSIVTFMLLIYTLLGNYYEKKLQKAYKRAKENAITKDRILGFLSHETRTPMNLIQHEAEKLKLSAHLNLEEKEKVDSVLFSSVNINQIVNQVLDFLKNDNSKLILYSSNFVLSETFENIVKSVQTITDRKNLKLIVNSQINPKLIVFGDKGKLTQLFYNLISNCVKFTEKGSVTIDLKTELQPNGKIKFIAKIQDTGIGIKKEELEHVFDKFFQGKNNSKLSNKEVGTGLGLGICKEIITLQEGEISVNSQVGVGTAFDFYFFFDSENKQKNNQTEEQNINISENSTIVLVDDDVVTREILKTYLSKYNLKVTMFDNAEQAIDFIVTKKVDLVITDIELPGKSGIDLLQEVSKNRKTTMPPILAMTGELNFDEEYLKQGFQSVLHKPISAQELIKNINQYA